MKNLFRSDPNSKIILLTFHSLLHGVQSGDYLVLHLVDAESSTPDGPTQSRTEKSPEEVVNDSFKNMQIQRRVATRNGSKNTGKSNIKNGKR